jgi:hypothetical protein
VPLRVRTGIAIAEGWQAIGYAVGRMGGAQDRAVRPLFAQRGSCAPNKANDELRAIAALVLTVGRPFSVCE